MNATQYQYYQKRILELITFFSKCNNRPEIVKELQKIRFNSFRKTIGYYKTDNLNLDMIGCYLPLSEIEIFK